MAARPSLLSSVARGVVAGVAGTVVMTAFQLFVEMPISKRGESFATADFAEKVLPVHPTTESGRRALNWATHFALGTVWGAAYGVAAHSGWRGARGIGVVFATVYTGDLLLNTALGLYKPGSWTRQQWTIDLLNKFVQAAGTGIVYDRLLAPAKER